MKALKIILFSGLTVVLFLAGAVSAGEIGRLDASFGQNGRVVTAPGIFADQAYAVQVQPDGRILTAGSSSNGINLDFALIRYTPDGELDTTFNFNGIVTTQVGSDDDEIAAIALQEDGYIVAAGYTMNSGSRDFALIRYTAEGQLDSSFGEGGIVIDEYGSGNDEITALAVDPEGRLVIAGYATGTAGRAVIAGRYHSSGAPDLSFGYNGQSLIGIGQDALARSVDIDEEGRIVIAGSFYHEGRTEAMVLRFTEDGELDNEFGVEGLAVPFQIREHTDGYGVRVSDDGSIIVAGSTGSEGGLDTVLFRFTAAGRPDTGFGNNGMLIVSAAQEDDMALAVDVLDGVVIASGFAVVDGVREFLLISHREDVRDEGVAFALKTGDNTTGLQINELQVTDSYGRYSSNTDGGDRVTAQTTILTTPFGYFSEDISYAVAVQPDGRAVAAGLTEENEVTSFAVARYATTRALENEFETSAAGSGASWIETKEPFEVTRNGAYTGGVIQDSGNTIAKRGVVFSVAPDPVLKEGGTDTNPPANGGNSGAPVITGTRDIQLPAGSTSTTLQITTNENATCRYATASGTSFDAMTLTFDTTGGTSHSESVSGLQSGQPNNFFVRCRDAEGNANTTDFQITVTVGSPTGNAATLRQVERYAGSIGSLLVGTANAQDTDVTIGNSSLTVTTTDTKFTTSDSVFDMSSPQYALEGFTEDGAGTGAYSSILTGLRPGTFYFVRAYAITGDGKIFYGNQTGFKTADACFIATAAYGSLYHPYVSILRDFRDRYLLTNVPGDYLVRAYYRHSPPAAEYIADHPVVRRMVQVGLLPVVGLGWLAVHYGASVLLVMATMMLVSGCAVRRSMRPAKNQQPA